MALTVCIYYICWVPLLVIVILKSLFSLLDDVSPKIVAYCFVLSNSTMNFFIYIYCMKEFREQFKGLFCSRNRRRVRCYASDPTESRNIRMKSIKSIDLHSNYRWLTRNNPFREQALYKSLRLTFSCFCAQVRNQAGYPDLRCAHRLATRMIGGWRLCFHLEQLCWQKKPFINTNIFSIIGS